MGIGILVAIIVGVIMGFDAQARGMNGWLWGFLIASFMIVFLPVYLMIRKPRINR